MAVRRLAADQPAAFAFTPENQAWAEAKVRDYPDGRQASAVIPILWKAQEQNKGWLPEPAIRLVADMLAMPYIRVFEVATFYTMFQLQPVGRIAHVNVCGTTPCMLRGSEDIVAVCRRRIAPRPFELSADGKFSWEEVECAGACVNAPMVQINFDTYEDLTPETFEAVLDAFAAGRKPKPGPQSARKASEPITGATTLTSPDRHSRPEGEEVSSTTPNADVDPTSPAAAGQKAGRPVTRDRPDVEATRLSDAPAGDASPVAPEPQTSGQPGGVDEPGRQKSAHGSDTPDDRPVGDASDASASAAADAAEAAPASPAAPTAGVEQTEPGALVDEAQANRAAPGAQYADSATREASPPPGAANDAAASAPAGHASAPAEARREDADDAGNQSVPPQAVGSGEVEHGDAGAGREIGEPDALTAAGLGEVQRSGDAGAGSGLGEPDAPTAGGPGEDERGRGAAEGSSGTATGDPRGSEAAGVTVESEIVDVAPPAPGTTADLRTDRVGEDSDTAGEHRPGAPTMSFAAPDVRPGAEAGRGFSGGVSDEGAPTMSSTRASGYGDGDGTASAGDDETVESEMVDVAPPAPGTAGDFGTGPGGRGEEHAGPGATDAEAGNHGERGHVEPGATGAAPPAPDPHAAVRADEVGRRPAPRARAEFSELDNLQRISGIGPVLEKTLHNLGIYTFAQIAAWDQSNKDWMAAYLSFKGRIEREHWVEQAQAIVGSEGGG